MQKSLIVALLLALKFFSISKAKLSLASFRVSDFPRVSEDIKEVGKTGVQFIIGFVEGFVDEDADILMNCDATVSDVGENIEQAIKGFQRKDPISLISSITSLITLALDIPKTFQQCKEAAPLMADVKEKLSHIKNPGHIAQQLAQLAIVHNKQFLADIINPFKQFQLGNPKEAGRAFGKLLARILG
ncbi:UNKNOWN [Stylonychia lemnae]|uniref:Uncharacterized protein n=1 Tax=Stylonychia lemnae TaxID=5949 RepID=A0A078AJ72_STYLE|nr:UNKNOWN [Stylonychia lemnae]|eukprot:CDW82269.1 UNKNOWN [Stylonychia lemnae]